MKKKILVNGEEKMVDIVARIGDSAMFVFNDVEYHFHRVGKNSERVILMKNGINSKIPIAYTAKGAAFISFGEDDFKVEAPVKGRTKKSREEASGHMTSPMPGKILKVISSVGDIVVKGDPILVMEAMKMEHTIKANCNGKVDAIYCNEGEQVPGGKELVIIIEEK
jgi:3-methylcrotonyl-CoA carboxylase alpha subunit